MITEKEYLEAKMIVKLYESMHQIDSNINFDRSLKQISFKHIPPPPPPPLEPEFEKVLIKTFKKNLSQTPTKL